MEKWNLYNRRGELTDRIHLRGHLIPKGFYHLVIHIWLQDEHGKHLIQKRGMHLGNQPGIWAFTGGSALAGESSLQATQRETMEELGLDLKAEDINFVTRLWRETHILDIWRGFIDSDFIDRFNPTEEVDSIDFKHPKEIIKMISEGLFYPYPDDYFVNLNIRTYP